MASASKAALPSTILFGNGCTSRGAASTISPPPIIAAYQGSATNANVRAQTAEATTALMEPQRTIVPETVRSAVARECAGKCPAATTMNMQMVSAIAMKRNNDGQGGKGILQTCRLGGVIAGRNGSLDPILRR